MSGGAVRLDRDGEVFVLTMADGENRWTTTFTRELAAALDEVEASEGPAALVTASADPKFYSYGLDVAWLMGRDDDHPGGDRRAFAREAMALFARLITFRCRRSPPSAGTFGRG